jgi:hypothetical protein
MEEVDSLKENSSWGGKREGAGRPEGSVNETTKLKLEAERELKDRIIGNTQRLLDKQFSLAEGCQYLFVIHTEYDKKGKTHKSKPELVTNPDIIQRFLDGEFEGSSDDEYYFMTTERPDGRALDSLLDRAFGKATQSMDLTSKGKQLEGIKVEIVNPRGEEDVPTTETN